MRVGTRLSSSSDIAPSHVQAQGTAPRFSTYFIDFMQKRFSAGGGADSTVTKTQFLEAYADYETTLAHATGADAAWRDNPNSYLDPKAAYKLLCHVDMDSPLTVHDFQLLHTYTHSENTKEKAKLDEARVENDYFPLHALVDIAFKPETPAAPATAEAPSSAPQELEPIPQETPPAREALQMVSAPAAQKSHPHKSVKEPHGYTPGTITRINAYSKKDWKTGHGDRLSFPTAKMVNFDNNESYKDLVAEVAAHPAEKIVVGSHGNDGWIMFDRDDGSSTWVKTLEYVRQQLDACAARGWMPAELFITGCEGCSEITPEDLKTLSLEYPGVALIASPTINTVDAETGRIAGEYYEFKDGWMKKSKYFSINKSTYGEKGNPEIINGPKDDQNYKYWRKIYNDELKSQSLAAK